MKYVCVGDIVENCATTEATATISNQPLQLMKNVWRYQRCCLRFNFSSICCVTAKALFFFCSKLFNLKRLCAMLKLPWYLSASVCLRIIVVAYCIVCILRCSCILSAKYAADIARTAVFWPTVR